MQLRVSRLPWFRNWIGLLGTKKPVSIYFSTRFGIHTFCMQYPIDVIILDRKLIIRKLKSNLLPNNVFFWNPQYSRVVELATGTIAKKKLKIGDAIDLNFI